MLAAQLTAKIGNPRQMFPGKQKYQRTIYGIFTAVNVSKALDR